jgi:hypothetical protein
MKVGLGTVVYQNAFKFHNDFIKSINSQDFFEFDVILLNDDLSIDEYHTLINKLERKVVKLFVNEDNSISENRIQLISYAKNKEYDLLVLLDFDDTMSENRIRTLVDNFDNEYCFFYNNLYYQNSGKIFFDFIPLKIESIDYLLEKNFLGLSNTSLNISKIEQNIIEVLIKKQTLVFDWMLYSILLINGFKGKRVDECKSFYRIHNQNIAGETVFTEEKLIQELNIKIEHYSKLIDVCEDYVELLNNYNNISANFEKYRSILFEQTKIFNNYWWGKINTNIILKEKKSEN